MINEFGLKLGKRALEQLKRKSSQSENYISGYFFANGRKALVVANECSFYLTTAKQLEQDAKREQRASLRKRYQTG